MSRYIVKRFLTIVPVLVGISIIVFGFIHLIPGDPAVTMLGERATPERVTEVRAQLGLDQPLYAQYAIYAGKVLRGDLGVSILRGDPVLLDLIRRFPATVELALAAICIAMLIGVPSGIVSAVWRDSFFDGCSRIIALTGVSVPIFWLGLMLAWVFGVLLGWLPTGFRLGTKVTLVGLAQSNARVSTLMRNIEGSPWLGQPELVEIKSVPVPGQGRDPNAAKINEFTLNLQVKRASPPADAAPGAARPVGAAAGSTPGAVGVPVPAAKPAGTPATPSPAPAAAKGAKA